MHIVDRRLNPSGKSLENRQRFLARSKRAAQEAVHNATKNRSIIDIAKEGDVTIPSHGIEEPTFAHAGGGRHERIFPGNKTFVEGDRIARQQRKKGGTGAGEGDGMDIFRYVLSREEFLDLFLDDLELPDLERKSLIEGEHDGLERAGYTTSGSPANMAISRTTQKALERRIAHKRPKRAQLEALKKEIEACIDAEHKKELQAELEALERKRRAISFIDPMDVRYRAFVQKPHYVSQAVMFCLMDVSGSMSEHMKDLAKRFYMLLYIFLTRRYKKVELVFIRHTDKAEEVSEETFFQDPASGGTKVSSALEEMDRIVDERFDPQHWNIYAAQASDGDNSNADANTIEVLMTESILPQVQYFAYLEVAEEGTDAIDFSMSSSSLWQTYLDLCAKGAPIAMRKVSERKEIFPVFRELFKRKESAA